MNKSEITPYDTEYPIQLLKKTIDEKLDEVKTTTDGLISAVKRELPKAIALADAKTESGIRYVADLTPEQIRAIDNDEIKLAVEKGGKTFAQLKVNGKYGEKIPIVREEFGNEIDTAALANAMQMAAIKEQLDEIQSQLVSIDANVQEIVVGQQTDRISLYYSGIELLLEAKCVTDPELKTQLISQAMKSFSDARFQLILKMKSDIEYLEDKKFDNEKQKRQQRIDEHMNSINQSFAIIHQATIMKAAVYCQLGENRAMSAVLDEYSGFIERVISSKAELLSQYDKNDDGSVRGVWLTRKNLKLDMFDVMDKLDAPVQEIYLNEISKEDSLYES